jgi:hypothetical protein
MVKNARVLAVALSAVATSMFAATPAFAQFESTPPPTANLPPPPETVPPPTNNMANRGLQFGARVGYQYGSGIVFTGFSLDDGSRGAMPLVVDVGWRFLPQLYVGLYGQYAPVFLRTNNVSCFEGFTCAAQDYRMGGEADFHFLPRSPYDPYVGLGVGYEILHTHVSGPVLVPTPGGVVPANTDVSITDRGMEFGTIYIGFDWRVDPRVGVGLYASASLNEYNVHSGTQNVFVNGTQVSSGPIPDVNHGTHEFYSAGVRGTFNPLDL